MLLPKQVHVTIVHRSTGEKCEAACGLDWSSAEIFAVLTRRVKDRFGETAVLEIVDLSKDKAAAAGMSDRIKKEGLSLPLLLVDDEVRISGEFDARQLMDAIEVEKELKWKTNMT
jgi:disulfide oxidoreductase YuzD